MHHTTFRPRRLAAVLALMPFAASAQVTLSGTVDVYAGSIKLAGDAGRTTALSGGGLTTSWIGFSAAEDLGGGLRAGMNLAAFFRPDSGAFGRFNGDAFWGRASNVFVSGSWGTVTLGRAAAPNAVPTLQFNPFGGSFAFSPLHLHKSIDLFNPSGWRSTLPADTVWSNQVVYTLPAWSPQFTANVHYQFGERSGDSGPHNRGINATYRWSNLAATAYYERDQITNPAGTPIAGAGGTVDTKTDWMLGASWDAGVAKLFATHGQTKTDGTGLTARTTSLGVSAPVGVGALLAAGARTLLSTGAERTTISAGYDHHLSKRTDVYAVAMHDRVSGFSSGTSFAVGIRHRF